MRFEMMLWGSSRSPETIAVSEHTISHAGLSPTSTRCAQKLLLRGVLIRVDVEGVVRARLHVRLAADAAARVEVDDPVFAAEERLGRADRDARRVVAVVAAQHRE